MGKINTTDVCKLVFAAFITAALMLIGCGGGGGGGRQTLPGENPIGPVIVPGTDTGSSTGTNTGTGTDTGVSILTPAEMLKKGWSMIAEGNHGGSIPYFSNTLNDSSATPEQRQQAFNGLGWAKSKSGIIEGLDSFKKSYQLGVLDENSYKESVLGYALALIQTAKEDNIDRAIDLLENTLQLAEPSYQLSIEHTCIGVTSPEAHAMLAHAYSWRGRKIEAKAQILRARLDDPSNGSVVAQIYETLVAINGF